MIGQQTRILVVEDHRILREGLRAILDAQADFLVVGEAGDGREAISRARDLRPDVVLLDISMPRMNGLEAIQGLKRVAPGARVVILTVHGDLEYVEGALRAGADGFLTKDSSGEDLTKGVRSVARGTRFLCQAVADLRAVAVANGNVTALASGTALSQREREVLKLVAEGYRSREIAACLCISIKTVEKHRSSLMHKIGVTNVSGLTAYAIERDLVCPLVKNPQGPARLDSRPRATAGADAQLATRERGPLAHGAQAQARSPTRHPAGVGGGAEAVVADPQAEPARIQPQTHPDQLALAVPGGVGAGLLEDAEDWGLEGRGDVGLGHREVVSYPQAGMELGETAQEPAEGREQP